MSSKSASSPNGAAPAAAVIAQGATAAVPRALLENLAVRFRPSGLFLVLLDADGCVVYHDTVAGPFFHRFILPMLQHDNRMDGGLREHLNSQNAGAPVTVWSALPGVAIAAFPYVERRQKVGTIVLAAKAMSFSLGEDEIRVCGRLGLDATWLGQ